MTPPRLGQAPLDLVAGNAVGAVSLPLVMRAAASTPEGKDAVRGIVAKLEAMTGIKLPESAIDAVIADPNKLAALTALTPAQMAQGLALRDASDKPAAAPVWALPRTIDLADLGALDVPRPVFELKELAPGLLSGDIKSDLSDAQVRANIVTAEMFTRLAANGSASAAERFAVTLSGKSYTRLDNLLAALVKSGHHVEVAVAHRIANFANLKTRAPDGTLLDVPAPLLVRTGVRDVSGQEAAVPAAHSELRIKIGGPMLNADVKWYQGVSSTGFFPLGLDKAPAWLGEVVPDKLLGSKALKAIEMAGLLTDVVASVSKRAGLANDGYGVTGVCNDSVAIIQHALTGHATGYPLVMRDEVMLAELALRLGDSVRRDDPEYRQLKASIEAVPSDIAPDLTARARALSSLPWAVGKEPLNVAADARRILSGKP